MSPLTLSLSVMSFFYGIKEELGGGNEYVIYHLFSLPFELVISFVDRYVYLHRLFEGPSVDK